MIIYIYKKDATPTVNIPFFRCMYIILLFYHVGPFRSSPSLLVTLDVMCSAFLIFLLGGESGEDALDAFMSSINNRLDSDKVAQLRRELTQLQMHLRNVAILRDAARPALDVLAPVRSLPVSSSARTVGSTAASLSVAPESTSVPTARDTIVATKPSAHASHDVSVRSTADDEKKSESLRGSSDNMTSPMEASSVKESLISTDSAQDNDIELTGGLIIPKVKFTN